MTKRPLLILHGWSDKSESFKPLSTYLKKAGVKVVDIWLADYFSMYDEITINDLGEAMGRAIADKKIPQEPHSFDVIVHSTGGLVVRQYLFHYFGRQPRKCPIRHLLMFAPANFGSPLAHIGKSMIGRLRMGWNWDHLFQTGTRVLEALELASPISWDMAQNDLFNPDNKLFTPANIYTTVLVGTDAYTGLEGAIHENGSDGTVRVSTANLNASFIKLVFKESGIEVNPQQKYYDPIAFGVAYNQNHGSIVEPKNWDEELKGLVLKSLQINNKQEYNEHIKALGKMTEATFVKGILEKEKMKRYHQYQHVVTRVHDQFGESVPDYFMEFYQQQGDEDDRVFQKVQGEILEKVKPYSRDSSYRSFLFDITDMKREILEKGQRVDMSLCAAALSERITYLNTKEFLTVVSAKAQTLLQPNTTLFVDIELPRLQSDKVFQLKKA